MPTTTRSREGIYEKAGRILSDPNRVRTIQRQGEDFWIGFVEGDHGVYKVAVVSEDYAEFLGHPRDQRLSCRCKAGRTGKLCSHAIVGEEKRLEGESQ